MIDTSSIDILAWIEQDTKLKRVASTEGGEYKGPCPFCGGEDRFSVQPHHPSGRGRWSCRQCSVRWQDIIAYVEQRDTVGFKEACQILNLELPAQNRSGRRFQKQLNRGRYTEPKTHQNGSQKDWIALNSDDWQQGALALVYASFQALWHTPQGHAARQWLHNRGLSDEVIRSCCLGFNPHSRHEPEELWGFPRNGSGKNIWLPSGITIPWYIQGKFWRVNIRQLEGTPKYISPKGYANGLYNVDAIQLDCIVVMVEGEFDVLAMATHAGDILAQYNIVPVATGSSNGARIPRWVMRVGLARRVLLAFDADHAGDEAADWWHDSLGEMADRLKPTQHDVTDMVKAGDDVRGWLLKTVKDTAS